MVVMGHEVLTMVRSLGVLVVVFAVVACSAPGAPSGDSRPSSGAPPNAAVDRPVDETLEAVSASAPTVEAKAAMELCNVDPAGGTISGMALVPSGKDVAKYVPMQGTEPELKTERPVWVIQLKGEIEGRVGTMVDPTCVVVSGIPTLYLTNGAIDNGVRWTAEPVKEPPTLSLPPLAP